MRLESFDFSLIAATTGTLGQERLTLKSYGGWVHCVAFSPKGRWIASDSRYGTVQVWDVATGREILTLKGHIGWVNSVPFGPDDQHPRIATANTDGTIKLWDSVTGQETLTLKGHSGLLSTMAFSAMVNSVAFSPDGRRLASASFDRTVKIWDARPLDTELTDALAYNDRGNAWRSKQEFDRAIAYRDGKKAVESATKACELSGWKNRNNIDTLAAAVKWQSKAIELLTDEKDKDDYRRRFKLYNERKPYREKKP